MKYNELTKKLLSEGYTAENYPAHVRLAHCFEHEKDPLDNFYGGFEYQRWWIYEKTFKTPCGLQCKGSSCMTGMRIGEMEWTYENDMPTIRCPYNKGVCEKKHNLLPTDGPFKTRCNVHMVGEVYCYDGSVEGILKLHDEEIRLKRISFDLQRNGRTCINHMHYDLDKQEWRMHYDPEYCAARRCTGMHGMHGNIGEKAKCPVLGRELDPKRGNVFYDIRLTYRRYDLDGTLFEGQIDTELIKGKRYFDRPVSMDICRNCVRLCSDDIVRKVKLNNYNRELFFAEHHGREFKVEVFNIRAEQRVSRDLMQDLQDIKNGIRISYDSDLQEADKENKKERREAAKQRRIDKTEKRIMETGYDSLNQFEQNKAVKLLGSNRIDELAAAREEKIREQQERPVQLTLFDIL